MAAKLVDSFLLSHSRFPYGLPNRLGCCAKLRVFEPMHGSLKGKIILEIVEGTTVDGRPLPLKSLV